MRINQIRIIIKAVQEIPHESYQYPLKSFLEALFQSFHLYGKELQSFFLLDHEKIYVILFVLFLPKSRLLGAFSPLITLLIHLNHSYPSLLLRNHATPWVLNHTSSPLLHLRTTPSSSNHDHIGGISEV